MQLSPINNNSTAFKGYTDIKARRFINGYKKINRSKVTSAKDVSARTNSINISYNKLHNNINLMMDKLHRKTKLTVWDGQVKELQITNPITKKKLIFWQTVNMQELGNIVGNRILVSNPLPSNDVAAGSLALDLLRINSKNVDRFFYESAISELIQKAEKADNIFQKWKLKYHINKIIKYKKQCNIDSSETKETLLKKVNVAFSKSQTKEI